MASLKLCKFIENLKSYTNSYWQTDTCYICNLRNCTNLSAPINSNGGQLVENMQLPFVLIVMPHFLGVCVRVMFYS